MKPKKDTESAESKLLKKRAELAANGINLRELCAANNVSYQAARDVLCGRAIGRRGNSHHAAVFLGIKPNPEQLKG